MIEEEIALNNKSTKSRVESQSLSTGLLNTSEITALLQHVIEICRNPEAVKFQMSLRDRHTELHSFSTECTLLELLRDLPACLNRLWRWNEILIIEPYDPSQEDISSVDNETHAHH
jgi:hypothetical protein